MDVFFWGGDSHLGLHVFFRGGTPRGLLGTPIFQFLGTPTGSLGTPIFQFLGTPTGSLGTPIFQFLGTPQNDWGLHKNWKNSKKFFNLIFLRENDKVLKHVLRDVLSIHNDDLSIWDIFMKIFAFFCEKSVCHNFMEISWIDFFLSCDPKYFLYREMVIIIF